MAQDRKGVSHVIFLLNGMKRHVLAAIAFLEQGLEPQKVEQTL
jgi:hypothetical protein